MNAPFPHLGSAVPNQFDPAKAGTFQFAYDTLGPIFAAYLDRLDQHIRHFTLDHNARILFVARAGLRIRALYRAWLGARNRCEPEGLDYLWTSRLACAKGIWSRDWTELVKLIERELPEANLGEIIGAISKGTISPGFDDPYFATSSNEFARFIWSDDPIACGLRGHLEEQSVLFESMLAAARQGSERVVLVDSGWQGTLQAALSRAFPNTDWWGLYLGAIPSSIVGSHRQQMLGLVYDGESWDPSRPETAMILHRHLFEALLEPNVPSITALSRDAKGQLFVREAAALLADSPSEEDDPLFGGVMAAISQPVACEGAFRVNLHSRARQAHRDLARILSEPRREEVELLCPSPRSLDLGRDGAMQVVLSPATAPPQQSAEDRILAALWPTGQIALEYSPGTAPERLREWLRQRGGHLPRVGNQTPAASVRPLQDKPRVAVITRTMDRPQMLERALRSVATQSYEDYVHVVVCDGGPMDRLRATIAATAEVAPRLMIVNNVTNRGMEAASNIAIQNCDSEFIVIHDDDDTWHPDFLREAVAYLDSKAGQHYGGVVTGTEYVSEEVTPAGILEHGRRHYNPDLVSLPLVELARVNRFAPIAFLFRREIYNELGGFDERFEVLGDWDFNLRFLAHANIAVLPKILACYHHRDLGMTGLFANSVIGQRDKHAEYLAVLRNKFLREQGDPASATIAAAMVSAHHLPHDQPLYISQADNETSQWTQIADQRWALLTLMANEIASLRSQLNAKIDAYRIADERWVSAVMLANELSEARAERDQANAQALTARNEADTRWLLAAHYASEAHIAHRERDSTEAILNRLRNALDDIQRPTQ